MAKPISSSGTYPCATASLATSNRAGHHRFSAALCALLLLSLAVPSHADVFPSAPSPVSMTATDWSLAGTLALGRALDWSTTRRCLRHSWCEEEVLPTGLAKSNVGLAAFEFGALSLELCSLHELIRHRHRKAARAVAMFNASISLGVDGHNYAVARR
jgi:hypothetical protein